MTRDTMRASPLYTIAQESPVKTRPIVRLLIFVKFSDAPAAVGGGKLFIA